MVNNMLRDSISIINKSFINEAKNSPNLLSDIAMMEKYMAESYSERIFIELLQNSDDAMATTMKLFVTGKNIFVANNGRVFSDNDINSMCRSGASNKKRANSIGYRGVGFKSTSCLSNEILIFSNDTYFAFSKIKSANALGIKNLDKVPKIRIPFLLSRNEIDKEIDDTVKVLLEEGFTSIFIFENANINILVDELKEISGGYLIFLKSLKKIIIATEYIKKNYYINRIENKVLISGDETSNWLVINSIEKIDEISIAFKIDQNHNIIECHESEGVFHCYLPTSEKNGYKFKINGDFSTDPSRKHLYLDDRTEEIMDKSALLLFSLVKSIVNGSCNNNANILRLISNQMNLYKFSRLLHQKFINLLKNTKWIELKDNRIINIKDYRKKPNWLENNEYNSLQNSKYCNNLQAKGAFNSELGLLISVFLSEYSEREYTVKDFILILKETKFIYETDEYLIGKIYGFIIREVYKSKDTLSYDLGDCLIKIDNIIYKINDIINENIELPARVITGIEEVALSIQLKWFCNNIGIKINGNESCINRFLDSKKVDSGKNKNLFKSNKLNTLRKSMIKWRAAEESCVEIENMMNNKAEDVSKQNLGYDVKSITLDGEIRYIEVKFISKDKSFTMTNNEYSSAHQLGDCYYICLLEERKDELIATYIKNPIENLKMEKRIRQWEWYCDDYKGDEIILKLE